MHIMLCETIQGCNRNENINTKLLHVYNFKKNNIRLIHKRSRLKKGAMWFSYIHVPKDSIPVTTMAASEKSHFAVSMGGASFQLFS